MIAEDLLPPAGGHPPWSWRAPRHAGSGRALGLAQDGGRFSSPTGF